MSFHSFTPDVVLLALSLPDVDGITLCKTLRQQTQTPIIVVSINSRASEIIKAFTAGADDFLSKPFGMQELKARIMIAIRKSMQPPSTGNGPEIPATEHYPQLQLDPVRRYISVNGDMVETTFSSLMYLLSRIISKCLESSAVPQFFYLFSKHCTNNFGRTKDYLKFGRWGERIVRDCHPLRLRQKI